MKIRTAVDSGQFSAARDELKALQSADAGAFTGNNYDYLLARLGEEKGDRAGSEPGYQAVVDRRSLLAQYALWHLAQIARSTGDLMNERERLRQLIITTPTSLLREAATLRLAESFFESTDYGAVPVTLRPLTESRNIPVARQALALSGQALLRAGKAPEARELFTRLLAQMPDFSRPDDFALAAVRGLDNLDRTEAVKLISESEHLRRAEVYQFNRDFEGAAVHYLAVTENKDSSSTPDAFYQLGRGLYQRERFDDALKYLRRVIDEYGASSSARDALALSAAAYSRLKRTDDAVAAYRQFIERFPGAPNPERPYLNIIDVLRDAGRADEALSWIRQTRARFPDQLPGTLALFSQARIHLAQGAWSTAVTELELLKQATDLGGARISGGTTPAEVAFLRAFALEQLGRIDESVDAYLAIPEGRNEYYGFRANDRLRSLGTNAKTSAVIAGRIQQLQTAGNQAAGNNQPELSRRAAQAALRLGAEDPARAELLALVRSSYGKLPGYRFPSFQLLALKRQFVIPNNGVGIHYALDHHNLAMELFFLGLYDEGLPEFAAVRLEVSAGNADQTATTQGQETPAAETASPANLEYTLAVYALRGDLAKPAVAFGEQVWKSIPGDYLLDVAPRPLLELLYPAPYKKSLVKYTSGRNVDPRFVLSIARQESRFQANAKSVAAARGLMQFISATAADTARQLGRRDFQQDELYNPDTAIEFGAQYLSSLFQQFPNQPQAVAAAYNGGAENVARWVARSHTQDPDRYVPEIGFAQSKDYVYRVLSNFQVYQRLYTQTLQLQQ